MDHAGEAAIEITVEAPPDATDAWVLAVVAEVAAGCDDIHRALGGHGLKVVDHAGDHLREPEDGGDQ